MRLEVDQGLEEVDENRTAGESGYIRTIPVNGGCTTSDHDT